MTPELDTVAIKGLAEDHVTALFPAFEGRTVAVIALVLPDPTETLVEETDTEETATVMDTTHDAVTEPHRAVMTADPNPTAVMVPDAFTIAFVEFEVHVTVLFVVLDGNTVATNVRVFPIYIVAVV